MLCTGDMWSSEEYTQSLPSRTSPITRNIKARKIIKMNSDCVCVVKQEHGEPIVNRVLVLGRENREGLFEKVTFEGRPED